MDSICYLQPGKVIIELKTTRTTIPLFTKKYIAAVTACRPNVSLYKTVELLLIVNIHNVEFLCALFVSFYSVFENVACVVGARKAREAEIGIWARENANALTSPIFFHSLPSHVRTLVVQVINTSSASWIVLLPKVAQTLWELVRL